MVAAGKVAVITGAAKGVGRYVAHTFLHAGDKVVVVDRDEGLLQKTVRELLLISRDVMGISADVSHEDEVAEMVERVSTRFERIDILVNNVGIAPYFTLNENDRAPNSSISDLSDPIARNRLGGTYICTRHVLPIMKRQHCGHIINVFRAVPGSDTDEYTVSASREALQYFTRQVANEVRDSNICVVLMSPADGPIATDYVSAGERDELPGVEIVAGRFVLASGAGMDLSGQVLTCKDGYLDVAL